MRRIALAFAATVLVTSLAFADPGVRVSYPDGITRIELEGTWSNSWYMVWRGDSPTASYVPVTSGEVLCLGSCFIDDRDAVAGRTYHYRFDLLLPDGSRTSFGPYAVLASPNPATRLLARASPNPGVGTTQIELSIPGYGDRVQAEARLFDVRGRSVKHLHRGSLPRGITRLSWDGRDEGGRPLEPGVYFLRLSTGVGAAVSRVLRIR